MIPWKRPALETRQVHVPYMQTPPKVERGRPLNLLSYLFLKPAFMTRLGLGGGAVLLPALLNSKYVLISLSDGTHTKFVVRGNPRASYHVDVARPLVQWAKSKGILVSTR